jgi:hypothetical protein
MIKGFTIHGALGHAGILIASSSNCTITDCAINSCDGLELYGTTNCTVSGNILDNNYDAMLIIGNGNGDNLVCRNTIANNTVGIGCNSSNNEFYHNNFINNTYQVSNIRSTNFWDDGYPSGGNYWSDYKVIDAHSGQYQNQTGSDGIGDTPYPIDANNADHYPLMKPYPWSPHDIGITNVATSETVVALGSNLTINVTVFNYGTTTEYFNVTVYADAASVAALENVSLGSRESAAITVTWDTIGFPPLNYTISAYATPVFGETDTTDNTCVDGTLQIILPWGGGGGRMPYID